MFVANRYYNSPYLAAAAGNLGDALFGSPQREYTRAQTEATKEATEDRRITRDWVAQQREAILRMTDAWRAGMGINTSPGQKDLEQAIEAARSVAPELVMPAQPPAARSALTVPLPPEARTGLPGSGVLLPELQTPENFGNIAAGRPIAAGVPPGVDPEAYANATDFGREVYDAGNNGIVYDHDWLARELAKNGALPDGVAAPPGVMAQSSRGSLSVQTQSTNGAPAAGGAPSSFYDVLSAFTDQQPARIAPQQPGAMLADALLAYGPEATMQLLGAMQGQRNPYEELGVRALLGELGGERDFGRELALARLRGAYDLAGRGRSGSGVALDITPTEIEKLKQLVTVRLRQALPDPSSKEAQSKIDPDMIEAIVLRAAEIYQQTRNTGVAIDMAMEESGALDYLPREKKGFWPWLWGTDNYEAPEGPWTDYR